MTPTILHHNLKPKQWVKKLEAGVEAKSAVAIMFPGAELDYNSKRMGQHFRVRPILNSTAHQAASINSILKKTNSYAKHLQQHKAVCTKEKQIRPDA